MAAMVIGSNFHGFLSWWHLCQQVEQNNQPDLLQVEPDIKMAQVLQPIWR